MSKFSYLAATGMVTLAFACKQPSSRVPASSTPSLDNFVGDSVTKNICRGTNAVLAAREQIVTEETYRAIIASALSAVPASLQTVFFRDFKGRYILTDDIARDCKKNDPGLISCWQIDGVPTIFVKRETKGRDAVQNVEVTNANINHATVRSFAYFLSEFVVKLDPKAEGLVENAIFTEFKTALGEALVKDVAATPARAKVAELASDKATFGDHAFAEAYDSLHCSAETAAKLRSDFPSVTPIITEASTEIDAGLMGTAVQSGSQLGLWGRWGRGNGPVRQGLRNYGEFRRSGGGLFNVRRYRAGGGFIGRNRIGRWR